MDIIFACCLPLDKYASRLSIKDYCYLVFLSQVKVVKIFRTWHLSLNHLFCYIPQAFDIERIVVGNEIVDHSDVVGASPVGAAPTTYSFSP